MYGRKIYNLDKKEIDITGQKFNKLMAIKREPNTKKMNWLFQCECGRIKSILKYDVMAGKTTTCGCELRPKTKLNNTIKSMEGKKFNRLTVIEFSHLQKNNSFFKCKCDCGNEIITSSMSLKNGLTKSCGCFKMYKYQPGEIGLRSLYSHYRTSAKRNNRFFDLTLQEFKELTSQKCVYCGTGPLMIKTTNGNTPELIEYALYKYNGLDRVDSTKGYEKENIVPCCKWCNIAKREKTVQEFKNQITKIHNYLNQSNG
jgi:hypothetical protein